MIIIDERIENYPLFNNIKKGLTEEYLVFDCHPWGYIDIVPKSIFKRLFGWRIRLPYNGKPITIGYIKRPSKKEFDWATEVAKRIGLEKLIVQD